MPGATDLKFGTGLLNNIYVTSFVSKQLQTWRRYDTFDVLSAKFSPQTTITVAEDMYR
jgi:hypothetical protein